MISIPPNNAQTLVTFPGVEHLQKAKALLRMAGFADDQESRAAIQRMAEVHMAAAHAARMGRQ